jgi:peptidyl-prolyl cis-trans isomerase D
MLEQLRRNSRSFIIWILFGIIIAVFIISFGPQANPDSLGCGYSKSAALEVGGEELSMNSWRFAVNGMKNSGIPPQLRRQFAADLLVERELLAQAAEAQGFRVSDEMVNHAIAAGEFYILGSLIRQQDPRFWRDYRQLEMFAADLGLNNVVQLADEQRREQLAEMMRHLILRGAVSDEEVRQVYVNQNTRVTADYVKFEVARYRSALKLSEADLDRYATAHDADLKKEWDKEKAEWASAKPRALVRHILISKSRKPAAAEASPGEKPGDKPAAKPGDKPAAKPGDPSSKEPAPAELAKQVHERLAGGADFAAVAREVSDDPTRWRGGLVGWRPADSLGYGKEVVEAARKLKDGQVSDVIETERGFHIVRVEARSDKALTYEQKRQDLAVKLAPTYYARALARRDADQALAQAGTRPLEELFERKKSSGGNELSPEVMQQIRELQSQGGDIPMPTDMPAGGDDFEGALPEGEEGALPPPPPVEPTAPAAPADPASNEKAPAEGAGKQGFLIREGANVLAQSGGAQPPPPAPPGQPAQPTPPAGEPTTPPAGKPGAPPAKPGAPPAPATDLPEVEVEKPALQTVGPAPRVGDSLAGVGESRKLVADLFEKLEVGKLAPEVYEVGDVRGPSGGDGFVLVVLKARQEADLSKLEESRQRIVNDLTYGARQLGPSDAIWGKGVQHLSDWLRKRCEDTSKSGKIRISREVFNEGEGEEEQAPGYQPCATLSEPSIAGQLSTRMRNPRL